MKPESYTFFVASSRRGSFRKITVPVYALHILAILAVVGGITVLAAVGSYSRLLWKAGDYNTLRRQQDTLKHDYQQLQSSVQNTNQRLNSLQSLATEVAMTYGFMRFRESPFALDATSAAPAGELDHTIAEFNFLERTATSSALAKTGLHLLPSQPGLGEIAFTPSIWPVVGRISAGFGERMDPFSGEGAFHTGVDIVSQYGDSVHSTADGVVINAETHAGYGRLVVVDHGFGLTSWYGHLSNFNVTVGQHVRRGDVIGFTGVSGRTTGPHVHYEVRLNGAPVNPMRYLQHATVAD